MQRFGWEPCYGFALSPAGYFIPLGMHIVQAAILCYKVILKLVFRSVETVQALHQEPGQSLGACP